MHDSYKPDWWKWLKERYQAGDFDHEGDDIYSVYIYRIKRDNCVFKKGQKVFKIAKGSYLIPLVGRFKGGKSSRWVCYETDFDSSILGKGNLIRINKSFFFFLYKIYMSSQSKRERGVYRKENKLAKWQIKDEAVAAVKKKLHLERVFAVDEKIYRYASPKLLGRIFSLREEFDLRLNKILESSSGKP